MRTNYYECEVFFPVAWEWSDVNQWKVERGPFWHTSSDVNMMTGQLSLEVKWMN